MPYAVDKKSKIKIAVFGTCLALSTGLFVLGLQHNSIGSVNRYNALIATDKAGGDVNASLNELRGYIYTHMNSEVGGPNGIYPPVQLSGTFDRLTAAEDKRVKDINDDLYSEAQLHCEETGSQGFSGRNRLACINEYVDKNGATAEPVDDSFYKYDFVAPRWSPDIAGFSLAAMVISAVAFTFQVIVYFRTRHVIHLGN